MKRNQAPSEIPHHGEAFPPLAGNVREPAPTICLPSHSLSRALGQLSPPDLQARLKLADNNPDF